MNDTFLPTQSRDADDALEPISRTPALNLSTTKPCARPTAKTLLRLADYWRGRCVGGALPRRAAIDPTEIIVHLPWLFMAEVCNGGADYRYRLIGTSIVKANESDATGRSFRELYTDPAELDGARLGFDLACSTRAPAFVQGRAFWRPDWCYDRFEAVLLPLASDGNAVDTVLGEIAYLAPR